MTEEKFSLITKWGGMLLLLGAFANIWLVMRYREVYRDASQLEQTYPQQLAVYNAEERALEAVLRDFIARAPTDPGIAEILRRHNVIPATGTTKTVAPTHKP